MKGYILVFLINLTSAQADWLNMGFDEANTNNVVFGWGRPNELLPGWRIARGTNELDITGMNVSPPDLRYASIYDTNNNNGLGFPYPVENTYSVVLAPGPGEPISIQQRGTIPADAKSIEFSANGALVDMFVDRSLITLALREEIVDWGYPSPRKRAVAIGDISGYAGQEVELRFEAKTPLGGYPWHGIDSIIFSPNIIPEPATGVLLLGGVLAMAWMKRRAELDQET